MSNNRAFTLIEAVVAVLIGAIVVIAVGGLSERIFHHRTTTDSNSAAMSLAVWEMEKLLSDAVQQPSPFGCTPVASCPNLCPDPSTTVPSSSPALCAGTHQAILVNANGSSSVTGPYQLQWVVTDASSNATSSPLVVPTPAPGTFQVGAKRITVTATLPRNPFVSAGVVRFKAIDGV